MMTLADDRSFAKHPAIEVKAIHFLDEFLKNHSRHLHDKEPCLFNCPETSIKAGLDLKPFTRNDTVSIKERDSWREKHNQSIWSAVELVTIH